jgi:hypothetical protein
LKTPIIPSNCGLSLATLLALLASGCSKEDGKLPMYPAQGQVFFDSKPAHGAVIWLHPSYGADPSVPKPHGRVDKDGKFRLGTYSSDDGAPAGRYRIIIFWKGATKRGDEDGENLLPDRYQSLEDSGLPVVEIKAGDNQLPPLHLTR